MNNLKFRYVYQHEEDLEIADTRDSIWTLEQIAEGEPDNYIDICLSYSWKVIDINQYTGLKDKNGKEIFEGDIVKFKFGRGFAQSNIIFNSGSFYVENYHRLSYWEIQKSEIIGNKYENPELLNK